MIINGRIPSLDGFRAIAVIFVVFSHLVLMRLLPAPLHVVLEQLCFGILGVRIFFVISGFLITYLLLKERAANETIALKAFYTRRVLRIFPAFYFYLLVVGLLNYWLDLKVPPVQFLSASLYIQNFAPWGNAWLVAHSWTLAVEEQFYILWPLIFFFIRRLKSFSCWAAIVAAGSFFRVTQFKYPELANSVFAPFFSHADFLFSGCFMAFIAFYHYDVLTTQVKRVPAFTVYVVIMTVWLFTKLEFHGGYGKYFMPVSGGIINTGICFLLMYFILQHHTLGYKFLNLPPVMYIGRLSYGIYLWQQLFINHYNFWWTQFPQNIFLVFTAAYLSFLLVEKPFLRLKDKFTTMPVKQRQQEALE